MVDGRKKQIREAIIDFILDYVIGDEIDYTQLNDLKFFVINEFEEFDGINNAFCEYYQLGEWFKEMMDECEFDVEEFYQYFEKEIERRS